LVRGGLTKRGHRKNRREKKRTLERNGFECDEVARGKKGRVSRKRKKQKRVQLTEEAIGETMLGEATRWRAAAR